MTIWIDAQLSPAIAIGINASFAMEAVALRDVGLRDAKDRQIFSEAKRSAVVVMTRDSDFIRLLDEQGPPPQVIWVTCGNTSNSRLRDILAAILPKALELLHAGERLVEINAV